MPMPTLEEIEAVYGLSDPAFNTLPFEAQRVKWIALDSGRSVQEVVGAVLAFLTKIRDEKK